MLSGNRFFAVRGVRDLSFSGRTLGLLLLLMLGLPVLAQAASDLTVTNFHLTPVAPTALDLGDPLSIDLTLANNGDAAVGNFWIKFYASPDATVTGRDNDVLLGTYYAPPLEANATFSFLAANDNPLKFNLGQTGKKAIADLAAGTYYVGVMLDPDGYIAESDENNTFVCADRLAVVVQKPDKPAEPHLPVSGMNNVSAVRDLRWSDVAHASRYDIYMSKVEDADIEYDANDITSQIPNLTNMYVADVDGNGTKDVVTLTKKTTSDAGEVKGKIDIFFNDGAATPGFVKYEVEDSTDTVTNPTNLLVVDMDGDGDRDLVVADYGDPTKAITTEDESANGHLFFVENQTTVSEDGTATYKFVQRMISLLKTTVDSAGEPVITRLANMQGTVALAAGDLDQDGDIDLAAGSENANLDVLVLFFSDMKDRTKDTSGAVYPDYAQFTASVPNLVRKSSTGALAPNAAYPAPNAQRAVSGELRGINDMYVADLNKDGFYDLVVSSVQSDQVAWLMNENRAAAGSEAEFVAPFKPFSYHLIDSAIKSPVSIGVSDFDGDQAVDVVACGYSDSTVKWYQNVGPWFEIADTSNNEVQKTYGEMIPSFTGHLVTNTMGEVQSVTVGDVDGNNTPDIIVASAVADQVTWFGNDGATSPTVITFTPHDAIVGGPNRIHRVCTADMNNDQLLDLVCLSVFNNKVAWFQSKPLIDTDTDLLAQNVMSTSYLIPDPLLGKDLVRYKPDDFDFGKTYIWKLVAKAGPYATEGDTWSFRVQPARIDPNFTINPRDDDRDFAVLENDGLMDMRFGFVTDPRSLRSIAIYNYSIIRSTDHYVDFDDLGLLTNGDMSLADLNAPYTTVKYNMWLNPMDEGFYYVGAANLCSVPCDEDGVRNGIIDGLPDGYGGFNDGVPNTVGSEVGSVFEPTTNITYGDDVDWDKMLVLNYPAPPADPSPADESADVSIGRILTWGASQDATSYDFYLAAASDSQVSISPVTISTMAPLVKDVIAADIDGDGDIDPISACWGSQNTGKIEAYLNDGSATSPSFSPWPMAVDTGGPNHLAAAKIDSDNLVDIVCGLYNGGKVIWYHNSGGSRPTLTANVISENALACNCVQAGDLDGDGDNDAVSASFNGNRLAWYQNNGTGTFTANTIDTTTGMASYVIIADVNSDGHPDLVASFWNSNAVVWYENDGAATPTFTPHPVSTQAQEVVGLTAADFDNDGDLDLASASESDNAIYWYESDGSVPPVFTPHLLTSTAFKARSVAAVDFNHDGLMDLIAGVPGAAQVIWYRNNTGMAMSFSPTVIYSGPNAISSVYGADLNKDGYPEIVTGSSANNTVAYLDYNVGYTFGNGLVKMVSDLSSPLYYWIDPANRPADFEGVQPSNAYHWQVVSKNTLFFMNDDTFTSYTRTTSGPVWTFTTGQPDLVGSNVTFSPGSVAQGETIKVNFTEKNIGPSDARGHWTQVWLSPDSIISRSGNDIPIGRIWVGYQEAGVSTNQEIDINSGAAGWDGFDNTIKMIPVGTYSVALFVDSYNHEDAELDENNKVVATQKLTVTKGNAAQAWSLYQ